MSDEYEIFVGDEVYFDPFTIVEWNKIFVDYIISSLTINYTEKDSLLDIELVSLHINKG